MKKGVDKLAPSAFTSPKQPLKHVTYVICNGLAVKYYEQTFCISEL